jgi:hypothetical protein
MFCQFCGSPIDASATVCPKCGKAQTRAGARAASGSNVGDQIGSSAKDAFGAFTSIITNPVGGLAPAYTSLGPTRALGAGIALSVFFALIVSLGIVLGEASFLAAILFFPGSEGFGLFIRSFVALLFLPAAMIATSFGIRKLMSGDAPIGADAYTVGAALTPFGIAAFLGMIIGSNSAELAFMLIQFGMMYLILIMYAGFTRLGGVTEKAAAPAVPLTFIVSVFICRVIFDVLNR